MLLNAQPRSTNRARINLLFNGAPPYTPEEASTNHIATNVNFLEATDADHSARRQISNALTAADPLFTVNVDYGPVHKKAQWGSIITKALNRQLKNSAEYLDLLDGNGASVVLHGIGPSIWEDKERWLPCELGVEDILVPSNTLRSLRNLPFFAVYRSYTVNQLWNMTKGPRVDPGWNMEVVDAALKWIDEATGKLMTDNWKDQWYPEKMVERFKGDGGAYASDMVPTIDCYDFFFWHDNGKQSGWNRRIIIDAWGQPGVGQLAPNTKSPTDRRADTKFAKGKFLYNSGDRVYADKKEKIIHFQFGDASAVSPFRYHSIRSLGFLLYAVCHLQNRLKCKFNDATFEALMQYFRVNDPADRDRLQKIDLVHMGILPEGLQFVKPEERWKVDQALVSEAIGMNRQSIADHGASFTQDYDEEGGEGETATRTMAKVNSQASMVSSMVNMMYAREVFRNREICRRFCIKNSKDKDVRKFRVQCLKEGVPEEALNSECWDLQMNRVMGGGNKMLEVAIAEKLMAVRAAHPPEAQSEILRIYDAAITGNYKLANSLVPEMPQVSDTVHDTEQTFGTFLAGGDVRPRPGLNPVEVVQTMIELISGKVQEILQTDGMGTPQLVNGLSKAVVYTQAYIQQLEMDKTQKAIVKEFGDAIGQASNEIKAFTERQQQAAQAAQESNGSLDPKDAAKIQATVITAQTKAQLASQSHAQRTAQRQLQFEQQQKQDAEKHALELQKDAAETAMELNKREVVAD